MDGAALEPVLIPKLRWLRISCGLIRRSLPGGSRPIRSRMIDGKYRGLQWVFFSCSAQAFSVAGSLPNGSRGPRSEWMSITGRSLGDGKKDFPVVVRLHDLAPPDGRRAGCRVRRGLVQHGQVSAGTWTARNCTQSTSRRRADAGRSDVDRMLSRFGGQRRAVS